MTRLPGLLAFSVALISTLAISAGNANAKQLRAHQPAQSLGLKANGGGTLPDYQCGGAGRPACDDDFKSGCTAKGGTMSGPQGWGGQTCFTPGGW